MSCRHHDQPIPQQAVECHWRSRVARLTRSIWRAWTHSLASEPSVKLIGSQSQSHWSSRPLNSRPSAQNTAQPKSHDTTMTSTQRRSGDRSVACARPTAMAAARSNTRVEVAIDRWPDTADLVADRHIIVVGSGVVNAYAFTINNIMHPLRFLKSDGKIHHQLVAISDNGTMSFGTNAEDERDAGFVLVSKSPFSPTKAAVWVAGTRGTATQAAGLLFKDLVIDARSCVYRIGIDDHRPHPIGCVVVPVVDLDARRRHPAACPGVESEPRKRAVVVV
jgi:hypothetical protein